MDPVIAQIRQELNRLADAQIQETSRRFFKDEITCYGIKTPVVTDSCKEILERDQNPGETGNFHPL